jgi:hypothetical protein
MVCQGYLKFAVALGFGYLPSGNTEGVKFREPTLLPGLNSPEGISAVRDVRRRAIICWDRGEYVRDDKALF